MAAGVYQIRNTVTGKVYVGSSVDMQSRWDQHRAGLRRGNHHSSHLQHAWKKYGEGAFEFVVIAEIENVEGLLDVEQKWIDALNAADGNHGYNECPTAGNRLGFKLSAETKKKLSEIAKKQGRKPPPMPAEQKAAVMAKLHAMPRTPEWRAKMSESNRGKIISAEAREKSSVKLKAYFAEEPNRKRLLAQVKKASEINKGNQYAAGRKHPPEEIARRAAAIKAAWARRKAVGPVTHSAETRARIAEAKKGKKLSDEHREKIRQKSLGNKSRTGQTNSEETRAKMRAAHLKRKQSKEAVEKLSATIQRGKNQEQGVTP